MNRKMMHPAWQAAHELLSDPERWWRTLGNEAGSYSDAQIATSMRLMGYGDDLVVTSWLGARALTWEFPLVWIPINNNDSLDAYPGVVGAMQGDPLPALIDEMLLGFRFVDEGAHSLLATAMAVLNGVGPCN